VSIASRVGAVVVAVLVLAWLGLMLRDVRLEDRGVKAAGRLSVPGNTERAEADLRAAQLLNPDAGPDLARAVLLLQLDQPERAVALVEDVVRREPESTRAWRTLYELTRERDPARAERALATLRRLDPLTYDRR
jgi:hypothetical protein